MKINNFSCNILIRNRYNKVLVKKLIFERKHLLEYMFVATPDEIERIQIVNECLLNLTQKMYARTETLYRKYAMPYMI